MKIFIQNIPGRTTIKDIQAFIRPALKGLIPFTKIQVSSIEIITFRDIRLNLYEHHAIIDIPKDTEAKQLIRRLTRTKLLGKLVIVRPYWKRSWHNDKRSNHGIKSDMVGHGMRKYDRRRSSAELEIIEDISDKIEAVTHALRKYI